MANPSYRDIITSIKKGNYNPVYILMGEEPYYISSIVEALENRVVAPEDKDFNYNVYYGNDAEIETVIAAAQQFPVMAPRKLVVLKEAQTMTRAKDQLNKLSTYVGRPNQSSVLVIAYIGDSLNSTSALLKSAAKSNAVVFRSDVPKDYQLPVCLKDYCRDRNVAIDEKAVSMLCDYIGSPLSKLFGEVNKLIHIVGHDNARITPLHIEKNIGISKDYNNFEFTKALCNRDYSKCINIIRYFTNNPKNNPTVVTTGVLFNFFSKLVVSHFLQDKSDNAIMQACDLKNSYALKDIRTGLANYPPVHAVNAIHHLREFDAKSKGVNSFQKEYDLLQELVFKIMT